MNRGSKAKGLITFTYEIKDSKIVKLYPDDAKYNKKEYIEYVTKVAEKEIIKQKYITGTHLIKIWEDILKIKLNNL